MADRNMDASSDIADPDLQKFVNFNTNDTTDLQNALKDSSEVDLTLAYASEKLANLENLLLHVSSMQNDVGSIYVEDDQMSAELVENLFTYDLLTAVVDLELQELDNLTFDLQELIVACLRRLSVYGESAEVLIELLNKLHDSEDVIKQTSDRILEMKIQLAKMQMSSFSFKPNGWESDIVVGLKEFQLSSAEWKPEMPSVEQKRMVRMSEKFLEREIELEKKLAEAKRNEDDLRLKTRLTEQLAACMEVAAESALERFMEADNSAEVLMGISKEMLGKLQILQSNLDDSIEREEESKDKLRDCICLLNAKELSINELNAKVVTLMSDNSEVMDLRRKVQVLEEKLNEIESELTEADSSSEKSLQQIKEMENEIESLKAALYASEIQVEGAEQKVSHLTDSNLELTEELDFLKATNDDSSKKMDLLEEKLREYDIQLQHSKASTESSQEQQTLLYNAIWDMEILIDELKQKVANGESGIEEKEAKCVELSKIISELEKELVFWRSQTAVMEKSLMQSAFEKRSIAKEIGIETSFIMDTVMQIAMERECIQKQLISLTRENKLLRSNLSKAEKPNSVFTKVCNGEESILDHGDAEVSIMTTMEAAEISFADFQANSPFDNAPSTSFTHQNEKGSIDTTHIAGTAQNRKDESLAVYRKTRKIYAFMAILIVLLSVLASQLLPTKFGAIFWPSWG